MIFGTVKHNLDILYQMLWEMMLISHWMTLFNQLTVFKMGLRFLTFKL